MYEMFETVDIANAYWDDFEQESLNQKNAGTLTECKFSEHEAYIEDPSMCSYVVIVDEMLIIVMAVDKGAAEDCLDILGY